VVGGGSIGVEICDALMKWGTKVTLIKRTERILPSFDLDMAEIIAKYLEQKGVAILTSHIEGFIGKERGWKR